MNCYSLRKDHVIFDWILSYPIAVAHSHVTSTDSFRDYYATFEDPSTLPFKIKKI